MQTAMPYPAHARRTDRGACRGCPSGRSEGHEVERAIDGFRFGVDTEGTPGGIKLSLVHHDVLAH